MTLKNNYANFFLSLFLVCTTNLIAQPFSLPKLNFNYAAYEPYIDAQTMEIHHSKHHQGYVNKLNKAVQGTKFETMDLRKILLNGSLLDESIRNNAGGHYNHTLFWNILNPARDGENMREEFKSALIKEFHSLDSLKILLGNAAAKHFGSGWAWLILTPEKRLAVTSSANQDNPIMDVSSCRGIPIIGIDVWEHAYYLKYQNKRKDYLVGIWELLDWSMISNKYMEAMNDPFLQQIQENSWPEFKSFKLLLDQCKNASKKDEYNTLALKLYTNSLILLNSIRPEKYNSKEIDLRLKQLYKECKNLYKNSKKLLSKEQLASKYNSIRTQLIEIQSLD